MTDDIKEKALAMVRKEDGGYLNYDAAFAALYRAIEQHEAFRQEVSDVASVCAQHFCKQSWTVGELLNRQDHVAMLTRFIIPAPKPDPLVEVLKVTCGASLVVADELRAALDARGLEIRSKNDD